MTLTLMAVVLLGLILPLVYMNESVTDALRLAECGIFPPRDKNDYLSY